MRSTLPATRVRQRLAPRFALTLLAAVAVPLPNAVLGCPFCPTALAPTLGEQLSLADVAAVVALKSSTPAAGERAGQSVFEIIRLIKSDDKSPRPGQLVTIDIARETPAGSTELWFGSTRGKSVDWTMRVPAGEPVIRYLVDAPARETPMADRLAFYVRHLEHAEDSIADDAFREFAAAKFEDVKSAANSFPRDKVREWLSNEKTLLSRRGLYGLMLGLCGSAEDAGFLEQIIAIETDEIRFGIDGILGGYLYMTGEPGMRFVDEHKINDPKTPFAETYAAMQALRFLWTYGSERVPKPRILESMRRLIDRPALCDIVINDLGRWKDWTLQDRLMELYGTKDYDLPSIKRAIIRYMIASTKDVASEDAGDPPAHVVTG
ncbi:MAG: hypothetical protein EHM42_05500, partial [Planctomycetaceae bacterium]